LTTTSYSTPIGYIEQRPSDRKPAKKLPVDVANKSDSPFVIDTLADALPTTQHGPGHSQTRHTARLYGIGITLRS